MAIEYFCCYHSYLEVMEQLNDAEKGRLFTACLLYSKTGEAQELSGNERFVFPAFKAQIDRDNQKYAARCKQQAENARKRWDAMACDGMPTDANDANTKEKAKTNTKEKAKESIYPPIALPGGRDFETFWSAYPKKVGKQVAKKAFSKVRVPVETLLAAIERQKCSDQWSKDNGQYIPNPTTWLNQGRWEDELPERVAVNEYRSRDTGFKTGNPFLEMLEEERGG